MYAGKLVFAQLMDHVPLHTFRRCVACYPSRYPTMLFSHLDQFLAMAFAQLTFRESLRDIETCLRAHSTKLYHLGIRGYIARSTLADANETRDWRVYRDFALSLIRVARQLYAGESFAVELEHTAYALDTTTIDLSLSLFPWARFRKTKAAVKLHTLLDLCGNIPTFIHISDGQLHKVNVLDSIAFEPGNFYMMDCGFLDFARLYRLYLAQAFFVIRAKSNLQYRRLYLHPIDKTTGLRCDQTFVLTGVRSCTGYPVQLRRITFYDAAHDKLLVLFTNNFALPARTVCDLYRCRWQVELFFKWIKHHLRIKALFGTSENVVKTQVWIAIAVYALVAIIKKRLNLDASLYTILQILSLTLFEQTSLNQLLADIEQETSPMTNSNQLNLNASPVDSAA